MPGVHLNANAEVKNLYETLFKKGLVKENFANIEKKLTVGRLTGGNQVLTFEAGKGKTYTAIFDKEGSFIKDRMKEVCEPVKLRNHTLRSTHKVEYTNRENPNILDTDRLYGSQNEYLGSRSLHKIYQNGEYTKCKFIMGPHHKLGDGRRINYRADGTREIEHGSDRLFFNNKGLPRPAIFDADASLWQLADNMSMKEMRVAIKEIFEGGHYVPPEWPSSRPSLPKFMEYIQTKFDPKTGNYIRHA